MRALFSVTGSLASRMPAPSVAPSCRSCGRLLASEASRARGYGPVCWRALTARTALLVVVPAQTIPDVIPGQVELPLVEHQPTLWSL